MMTPVLGFGPIRTGIAWRKFEYRYLASYEKNDKKSEEFQSEFHEKILKQVDELPVFSMVANDFTAWIEAIQKASIVELGREDPWTDDETLIQVRRMTAEDLESQVESPETEHEYEDTLDVIKLPLPIPFEANQYPPAPQFLFVRPDEYALFKCFGLQKWCIMTGNPGISKSWFQWKFILFSYRPDLFDQFSPVVDEILVDGLETEDQTSTEQEQVIPAEPFTPKLIVRTVAGEDSLFFFVGLETDVLYVDHSPKQLKLITDEHTMILWEPGSKPTPVYYEDVKAHIIVTVSPNDDLFHQFKKEAGMFYFPCPSELQLRLMGQIYRRFATGRNYPTDQEIRERVQYFGPFIRIVLSWSRKRLDDFKTERQEQTAKFVKDNKSLQIALESPVQIMESSGLCSGLSHRLARYIVHRDNTAYFLGYASSYYDFSSQEVQNLISVEVAKMDIETIQRHLIEINEGRVEASAAQHVYMEQVFRIYALKEINWKSRVMQLRTPGATQMEWQKFTLKLKLLNRTITTYENMAKNVLYYPADRSFPLVDLYYKDENDNLVGIQATMAEKHDKPVGTYMSFYEKIGTDPDKTPLKLYYFFLPRHTEHYSQVSFPESQFWMKVKDGIPEQLKKNTAFYALLPPANFGGDMPEE